VSHEVVEQRSMSKKRQVDHKWIAKEWTAEEIFDALAAPKIIIGFLEFQEF
jgi:hypothetical protein